MMMSRSNYHSLEGDGAGATGKISGTQSAHRALYGMDHAFLAMIAGCLIVLVAAMATAPSREPYSALVAGQAPIVQKR